MTEKILKINTEAQAATTYELYELVKATDKIMKTPTQKIDFDNPPEELTHLAMSMFHTMFHYKGLGLSANQVGKPYSVFTVGFDNENKQIFFNPEIVAVSPNDSVHVEGCLSYPGLFLNVKRPEWVIISWQHIDGKKNQMRYEGLTARVIQHEMDHIMGTNFTKKVGKTQLLLAKEKRDKLMKAANRAKKNPA